MRNAWLWNQRVAVGNRLGAQLELSRTYYEIGCFFRDRDTEKFDYSRKKDGKDYLVRVGKLFREMGLRWDAEM